MQILNRIYSLYIFKIGVFSCITKQKRQNKNEQEIRSKKSYNILYTIRYTHYKH